MQTLKNLAALLVLLPTLFFFLFILAIRSPAKARRIASDFWDGLTGRR